MLNFSFSTVFMTILTSNLLVIFMYFIFRNKKLLITVGYKLLYFFLFLTILRFLFPFELPITTTLYFPTFISRILAEILHPYFEIFNCSFSVWNILELIWFAGSLFFFIRFIKYNRKTWNYIKKCKASLPNKSRYEKIVQDICIEKNKPNKFELITLPNLDTPFVFFHKKPYILLPDLSDFTDQELYFILLHEMSHYFHYDFVLKYTMHVLAIIYWWNPFFHFLLSQSDLLIEMRVDDSLTQKNAQTTANYLSCLLHAARKNTNSDSISDNQINIHMVIPFSYKSESDITQRFHLLTNTRSDRRKKCSVLWLGSIILLFYTMSFFYIFESAYLLQHVIGEEENLVFSSPANTYAVQNEDGTYSIYFEDLLVERTDSLEYYSKDIPIIQKEEEHSEEKNN